MPRPANFQRIQGHLHMLMIIAYDTESVLLSNRVPTGETVNATY